MDTRKIQKDDHYHPVHQTTTDRVTHYRQHIDKMPALASRFNFLSTQVTSHIGLNAPSLNNSPTAACAGNSSAQ